MPQLAARRTRSRPRPRFWIVDDIEACMAPYSSPPPALQAIVAQRSIPIDDEPAPIAAMSEKGPYSTSTSPKSPTSLRRSKLLPNTGYYSGFVEKSSVPAPGTAPWYAFYNSGANGHDGHDADDEFSYAVASRRRQVARRLFLVFTLMFGVAYTAFHFSYIASGYYHTVYNAPSTVATVATDGLDVDKWLENEAHAALRSVIANIGPVAGAEDGIVIASPSKGGKDEPDYYYTWTRDAALTISSLLPFFIPETYLKPWETTALAAPTAYDNDTYALFEGLVRSYVTAQTSIQETPNPSGSLWTGGLSEPKFTVAGEPFTGSWGRPQRDGPALRALALIPYAHYLLDRDFPADKDYVTQHLYNPTVFRKGGSVIKNDLEEVANAWWLSSFDLWEEVNAFHLWTDAVSRRAMQAGAALANRLGDTLAADYYSMQAKAITIRLASYQRSDGIWNESIPTPEGRDGLDAGTILAVVHAGGNDTDAIELAATSASSLSTLRAYILSFEKLYKVNTGKWVDGWLVGRYNSDVYDGVGFTGGNPWYITTFSVAHVLYAAQAGFARAGSIDFGGAAAAFWADLGFNASSWRRIGDDTFSAALRRLGDVADAFVAAAARTVKAEGAMTEQIGRDDGVPRGARNLTWSYASLLEMKRARDSAKAAVGAATTFAASVGRRFIRDA